MQFTCTLIFCIILFLGSYNSEGVDKIIIASVLNDVYCRCCLSNPGDGKQFIANVEIGIVHILLSPQQLMIFLQIVQGFSAVGKYILCCELSLFSIQHY